MKKIFAFITALLLFTVCIYGYDYYLDKETASIIDEYDVDRIYSYIGTGNSLENSLNSKEKLLILGSSEFNPSTNIELSTFPTNFWNQNNYGFGVTLLGAGGTQSLYHAINVAAYEEEIENRKVVLIISPQWFTNDGVDPLSFQGTFNLQAYKKGMENKNLSKELSSKISGRCNELFVGSDSLIKEDISSIDDINLENSNDLFRNNELKVKLYKEQINAKRKLLKDFKGITKPSKPNTSGKKISTEVFDDTIINANITGEKYCKNNDFGIYDEYYSKYIEKSFGKLKNSYATLDYSNSKEYSDLQLFLDVCKETKITPLLISIPMNGKWYDYCGMTKEKREQYYNNIANIAEKNHVELVDYSNMEYQKYFLCDIMHLGWTGWGYLNEEFYNFYKEDIKGDSI